MHFIIEPFTFKLSSIMKFHYSFTLSSIVSEFASIRVTIRPVKFTLSILFILMIVTLKSCSIWKFLSALTLSHIKFPLSLIFSSVYRIISSITMSLIILPFSNINVTIRMNEPALTFSNTIFKVPTVSAAIGEIKFSQAILLSFSPLTNIKTIFIQLKWSLIKENQYVEHKIQNLI